MRVWTPCPAALFRTAWYSCGVSGFRGVQAAAVTPRGKNGEIDFGASFELIDHLSKAGVDGIVLFAAEGEYPAFTAEERSRLCYLAVKRSRVPVLVGVGSATLDDSLSLARDARDAGADGLLLPPPHFFQYDQEDVRAFYCQFAAEAGNETPILLYHTNASSGIAPATAADLLASGRFAAMVYAAGDALEFRAFDGVGPVLADDTALAAGLGDGVVSGAACAAPEVVIALSRAMQSGTAEEAERWRVCLRELLEWASRFPQPTLWKVATELRGLKTGPVAAALSPRKQCQLEEFRAWFQAWLPRVRKLSANA